MYIIELLVKYFKKDKFYEILDEYDRASANNPLEEFQDGNEPDSDTCNHIFMPIDSSNEVLACSICGLVVKKADLKKKNIFSR